MTFFYDLNKKLDTIREKPELKHGQLNERDMGKHNNATTGFDALAKKAGKEYGSKEAGERVAGAVKAKMAKSGKLEEQNMEEGLGSFVQKMGSVAKKGGTAVLKKIGHGDDADMMRDLQKKMNLPQTGLKPTGEPNPKIVKEKMSPAKAKSFAALAEPKDKITFADKIAGAKKEVDEMLGDVAAEAMKSALSGGQKKLDKNNNGKLDANDFAMLRKGRKQETDESGGAIDFDKVLDAIAALYGDDMWDNDAMQDLANDLEQAGPTDGELDFIISNGKLPKRLAGIKFSAGDDVQFGESFPTVASARANAEKMKTGDKIRGHKGEIEKADDNTIRHTRRYDNKTGETDTDDEGNAKSTEKRKAGRPEKANKKPERVTAKATKHKGGRKEKVEEGPDEGNDMVKLAKVISSCTTQAQLDTARRMAQNFLKKHQSGDMASYGPDMKRGIAVSKDIAKKRDEIGGVEEEAVSRDQAVAARIARGVQKGEVKAKKGSASAEMANMEPKELKKFAKTDTKGLPKKKEKTEGKKKEKTEEAGGTSTPTASSGFSYGKGIYDSMNFELEQMIAESMSINMSNSTEGGKSLTITATDDDAMKLSDLLKNAGMGSEGSMEQETCDTCGSEDCGCGDVHEAIAENEPEWPTDEVTSDDALQYSGGLNKPKSSGMATIPVTDVVADGEDMFGTPAHMNEDEYKADLRRMMEMSGLQTDEDTLDEDWKSKLAAAGTAAALGATGLGMMGGAGTNQYGAEYGAAQTGGGVGGSSFSQLNRAQSQVDAKADAFAKANPQFKQQLQQLRQQVDQKYGNNPMVQMQKQLEGTNALLAQYQANEGMFEQEEVEESLARFRSLAGIKEAKKAPEDFDNDGKVETGPEEHAGAVDKAIKKAQAEKKVDESIFALTNQWTAYKG